MIDVLKYIHEHISENLELSEVASKFGYSKWYLCNKFHKYTGKSFVKYVRHYRLSLAVLDIIQGKQSTKVAMDYGYETLGGFNKAFLSEFGCLPREYKKQMKEAQFYYERKKITMFQLSDRCEALRSLAVGVNDYEDCFCMQHRVYTTLGMLDAVKKGLSNSEIISSGIVNLLNNFNPVIIPGELIVGFNYPDSKYNEYFEPEDTDEHRSLARLNGISDNDIEVYFNGVSTNPVFIKYVAPEITREEKESRAEWAGIGRCIDSNHSVINYEKVLKLGFKGILDEVLALEKENGTNELYTSAKNICKAACNMGRKYAKKAHEIKNTKDELYYKEDLNSIISVCQNVPENPATTFKEAVQSLWFAHIINTWEDHINANSLGRLDQILYPYYKADIEKGILTKEDAFEIICCLWIKLYLNYDVQQSCVGGTAPDGSSQVNELSYMMLDATEQLDFVRCLSVRYSKNTEKEFLHRALEVVGHVQMICTPKVRPFGGAYFYGKERTNLQSLHAGIQNICYNGYARTPFKLWRNGKKVFARSISNICDRNNSTVGTHILRRRSRRSDERKTRQSLCRRRHKKRQTAEA